MSKTVLIGRTLAVAAAVAVLLTGCGDDDDGDDATADDPVEAVDDTGAAGEADPDEADSGTADSDDGSGSGTLVVDGETIELATVRCHLEPQPAAAGGGNILFVVQGEGTNAADEAVLVDISRYDEESMFAGDSVVIDIGDVLAGESVSLSSESGTNTVTLDGSTATAQDVPLIGEAGDEHTASFDVDC